MDHTWDESIFVDVALGAEGHERFPATTMRSFAPGALEAAITTHICYLSRITGNGTQFRVGPKWWAMVKRHGAEITANFDAS